MTTAAEVIPAEPIVAAQPAPQTRKALRDGGAMGLSVAIVGLFGFLSWNITARLADPSLVGKASTLINAMLLASAVGQLQLGNVLLRWLPESGYLAGAFLRRVYVTVAAVCVPVAVIVAVAMPDSTFSSFGEVAVFGVAVVVWALFSIQDQVLAGLWRASLIPIENGVFVVVRLILVVLLVPAGRFGILAAWIVPAAMMLILVSCALPALIRKAQAENRVRGRLPSRSDLMNFVGGNFVASLAQLAVWNGQPMIVTALVGSAAGGVFFVVWSMVVSIELAAIGFSSALVVRSGGDVTRLRSITRATAIWFAVTFLPGVTLVGVLARPLLALFGPEYAASGTVPLQFLMAGVACRLVPTLAIGVAQVRKESRVVLRLQAPFALALLAGSAWALHAADPGTALRDVSAVYLTTAAAVALAAAVYLSGGQVWTNVVRFVTPGLALASLACWWIGAMSTDAARVGLLGLVDALHPLAWAGLCLLAIALVIEICRRRPQPWRGYSLTVLLAIEAYALQPLVYGEARLPVAWLHAGWSDYVAAHGAVVANFDARFSWPGFFETIAMLSRAGGLDSASPMLRWAPVVFVLAWIIPIVLIGRALHLGNRAILIALGLFLGANWVEQEYFSPQAVAYLLYLSIVGLCMRLLCRRRSRHAEARHIGSHVPKRRRARVAAAPIVALGILALAPSHQLTPYLLLATLLILAFRAELRPRVILLIAFVAPVCWLVLGAHDFWSGHSNMITQDFGAVGQVVNQNFVTRVAGSAERTYAQAARLVVVGSLLVLATVGAARRWKNQRPEVLTVALLATAPGTFILVQSYGGEMILRSWLFALPWLAMLGASGLTPRPGRAGPTPVRILAVGCTMVFLTASGLFSRSSNDGFTRVSADQVAAMREVYAETRPGQRLAVLSSYLPWKFDKITEMTGVPVGDTCLDTEALAQCVVDADPDVVVVTRQQQIYGELVQHYPPGFVQAVVDQLVATRRYRVSRQADDITVLDRHAPVVLAMGDSVTLGDADPDRGYPGSRAWPSLIEAGHPTAYGALVNAGAQGNWTAQMRRRLPSLLQARRPDIVVLCGGTNDVRRRGSRAVASVNLEAMVGQIRSAGAEPVLVTIPPQQLPGGHTNAKGVTSMNVAIKRVAARTRTPLVDAYPALATGRGTWRAGLTIDGIHPSRPGAIILADLIEARIEAMTQPRDVAPFGTLHQISSDTSGSR